MTHRVNYSKFQNSMINRKRQRGKQKMILMKLGFFENLPGFLILYFIIALAPFFVIVDPPAPRFRSAKLSALDKSIFRKISKTVHATYPRVYNNSTQPDFPIDIVYTWVNGSDPVWEHKKKKMMLKMNIEIPKKADKSRYVDIGELKYSLRGVEKFIPWVHKIYIVTDDQVPNWLNTKHPKIQMVSHREIIPEEKLPTFNSNNLDFHLHRIPGLCEHFIYLNDDVFISRPMYPKNFFNESGYPRIPVAKINWTRRFALLNQTNDDADPNDMGSTQYTLLTLKTVLLCKNRFNQIINYRSRHGYIPLTKTLLQYCCDTFPEEIKGLEMRPFRDVSDIQLTTMIIQVGIGQKLAHKLHHSRAVRYFVMSGFFISKIRVFNYSDYYSFCLNSGEKTSDPMRNKAFDFLNSTYCPDKSLFEL